MVNTRLTQVSGIAEPTAALAMAAEIAGQGRVTLGADKGYDQKELVRALREYRVTPHVAQKVNSAIDRRGALRPTPATCSASGGANSGRDLRLAQDSRRTAQDSASWNRPGWLDLHLRRRCLQLGENA